jgi:hypothetical protein
MLWISGCHALSFGSFLGLQLIISVVTTSCSFIWDGILCNMGDMLGHLVVEAGPWQALFLCQDLGSLWPPVHGEEFGQNWPEIRMLQSDDSIYLGSLLIFQLP